MPPVSPFTFMGDSGQRGAYILRVAVAGPVAVSFGRFNHGEAIPLPAGEYLYLGSALGQKGAGSLARRLLRHATRSGAWPPHPIRAAMLAHFPAVGLGSRPLLPPPAKKLRWHIDYLLNCRNVDLTGAVIIRAGRPLEAKLGRLLAADAQTAIIAKGLGASDIKGNTHLLRVGGDAAWWASLPERIYPLIADS